jgi:hypothetical protein
MSCLFNSLGSLLKVDPAKLRADVCSFLEQHSAELVEGLDSQVVLESEVDVYVRKMRNASTWGGAVEIRSVCQMYGVETEVLTSHGTTVHFVPMSVSASAAQDLRVLKVHWTGSHYTPVGVYKRTPCD